ncbi:MAG: methyltransferase family protein [Candidatus Hermodarchaeota archaeon]
MLLVTIILIITFSLNLVIYWVIFLKNKENEEKHIFFKIFPVIWTLSLVPIPVINSSFLRMFFPNNYSYFGDFWIFFVLFGIVLIFIGIIFIKRANRVYKVKSIDEDSSKLITKGIFKLIRHPIYSAWGLIFFGVAIISDSLISLITSALIFILLEIHSIYEEKLILIPKYGNIYENYKNKTPNRIIPTPLNLLLIIITIIIAYVGFLNFN